MNVLHRLREGELVAPVDAHAHAQSLCGQVEQVPRLRGVRCICGGECGRTRGAVVARNRSLQRSTQRGRGWQLRCEQQVGTARALGGRRRSVGSRGCALRCGVRRCEHVVQRLL